MYATKDIIYYHSFRRTYVTPSTFVISYSYIYLIRSRYPKVGISTS